MAVVDTPYHEQVTIVEGRGSTFAVRVLDQLNQHDTRVYGLTLWQSQTGTFSLEGCVPPCLGVGADGSIGGTPMTVGTYDLTLIVTDAVGHVVRHPYTLFVRPTP